MPREDKSIETESRYVDARDLEEGRMEVTANGYRISPESDKNP